MAVGTLSEVWGDVQRASGAAAAITELLDSVADIKAPLAPVALPDPALGVVTFEDVGFCYPASPGRSALQGFTITVAQGETVALVGASGSGKSTIAMLLPRFYDPQAGSIRIGGHDLREVTTQSVRQAIGLVLEEAFLFSDSIKANIAYGHPEASQEQIAAAARAEIGRASCRERV